MCVCVSLEVIFGLHQSDMVTDRASLIPDSVVPVGHARTHTRTASPQKHAALCQGSSQFHSTQQNVFINISLMVDMYSGGRSVHHQQVLSPVPSGLSVCLFWAVVHVHTCAHTHTHSVCIILAFPIGQEIVPEYLGILKTGRRSFG